MNPNTHVCTACHTTYFWEKPDNVAFMALGVVSICSALAHPLLAPLWLVGLIIIIICVRARRNRCPTCKGKAVIPIDSPAALKIIRA
jgi:hypothetical protein